MKMTNEMWKKVENRLGMKIYLPNELETMEVHSTTFYKLNGLWFGGYSHTNVYMIDNLDDLIEECKKIVESAERVHNGHYILVAVKHPFSWWITRSDRVPRCTDPEGRKECPGCPAYCDRLRASSNGVSRNVTKIAITVDGEA